MKHLTTYKLFESILQREEVQVYIQDLFSDIRSTGVRVFCHKSSFPDLFTIKIGEYSDQISFRYNDISDEIEHLKSYFINEGNMRLGDVAVDVFETTQAARNDLFGRGVRLLGW